MALDIVRSLNHRLRLGQSERSWWFRKESGAWIQFRPIDMLMITIFSAWKYMGKSSIRKYRPYLSHELLSITTDRWCDLRKHLIFAWIKMCKICMCWFYNWSVSPLTPFPWKITCLSHREVCLHRSCHVRSYEDTTKIDCAQGVPSVSWIFPDTGSATGMKKSLRWPPP